MGEKQLACRILVSEPLSNWSLSKQGTKCEDDINMDLFVIFW
jgi:hypothetical protein